MRRFALLTPLMLVACSHAEPSIGRDTGRVCNASAAGNFVGQPGTSETGAAILRATNSAVLRWAPPGYMLTMDYSASRVTVHLDRAYKVTSINCG